MNKDEVEARFGIIRPEEFAETKNGVLAAGNLYERLWSFVHKYNAPRPEVSEEPCYGMDSIASFWDQFTEEEQATLIRLDDENNEAEKQMMRGYYKAKGQPIPDEYL